MPDPPHIVIVGAGFAGLSAARALARAPVRVTIVDRTNHHLFQPLLYQVATAGLNPGEIAAPVRAVLRRQKNLTSLMGTVDSIRLDAREVCIDQERICLQYDYLILAAGSRTSYFGHDQTWGAHARGLKTLEEARAIRESVLMAFETAEKETDPAAREKLMTMVIVGGGPTGVEMAGAFAELARHVLVRDFRNIRPEQAHVVLIEATDRLLPVYSQSVSDYTRERLTRMGVDVRLGTKVLDVREHLVKTTAGDFPAANIIWAAGVAACSLAAKVGAPQGPGGRIPVDPDLRIPGRERVYVVGDMNAYKHPHTNDGKPVPGLSPPAIQEGRTAALNILRQMAGKPTKTFVYKDPGSMATIGRSAAVGNVKGIEFKGFIAWLVWLVVHLMNIVDFESRVMVFLRWAWAYFRWKRGARVVTRGLDEILAERHEGERPDDLAEVATVAQPPQPPAEVKPPPAPPRSA
jgi:NADH dehydrogenase